MESAAKRDSRHLFIHFASPVHQGEFLPTRTWGSHHLRGSHHLPAKLTVFSALPACQTVQQAIDRQVDYLRIMHPKKRVVLITFSSQLHIYTRLDATPVTIGSCLDDEEMLYSKGQALGFQTSQTAWTPETDHRQLMAKVGWQ